MMIQFRNRVGLRRCFTMVELLITITLAAGGILSMVALTRLKSRMVAFERDLAVSQNVAQAIASQLAGEDLNWDASNPIDPTRTPLLFYGLNGTTTLPGGGLGQVWYALPNRTATGSPTFNPMAIPNGGIFGGAVPNVTNQAANDHYQEYCVHYRLQYQGGGQQIIEYEIRVFFPIQDASFAPANGFDDCGFATANANPPLSMADRSDLFNFYSLPGTVTE